MPVRSARTLRAEVRRRAVGRSKEPGQRGERIALRLELPDERLVGGEFLDERILVAAEIVLLEADALVERRDLFVQRVLARLEQPDPGVGAQLHRVEHLLAEALCG